MNDRTNEKRLAEMIQDYKDQDPLAVYKETTGVHSARVMRSIERMKAMVDALINHCDKECGECSVCGTICCPFGDSMHFHHDGCPSCYGMEEP